MQSDPDRCHARGWGDSSGHDNTTGSYFQDCFLTIDLNPWSHVVQQSGHFSGYNAFDISMTHHFGSFAAHFPAPPHPHTRWVGAVLYLVVTPMLIGGLIGAWDPML